MKNKFLILLLAIYCILTACQNNNLDGHWHLTKQYFLVEEENLNSKSVKLWDKHTAILDIGIDTGFWNKNKYDNKGIPLYIDKINKRIEINNEEYFQMNFSYDLKLDSLILYDFDSQNIMFKGIRCETGCCNKQSDEFLNVNLSIDLPIEDDTTLSDEYSIYRLYEQRIYIGRPKVNYFECFPSPRISINGKYVSLLDIPIIVEMNNVRIPHSSRGQMQYSLYSDKNIQLGYIVDLLQKFEEHGISNFNLALRDNTNLEEDFKLRLHKLKLRDMSKFPKEMKLSEFIRESKK